MKKLFDPYQDTKRVSYLFTAIIRIASLINRKKCKVKVVELNSIPKPPYLLLSTHASFMDFFEAIKATKPHRPYWVSTVEEFIGKEMVFRNLGVLPKRKFTNDPRSAKLMLEVLNDRKKILIIYPEARYSFVGKQERLDKGLAKLAKKTEVPIVFLKCNGNYLRNPQWGDHHNRKIKPLLAEMKCIVNQRHIKDLDVDEISEIIEENFKYDDEQYQLDNHILNTYRNRAKGIHHILYKCPHCGKEFMMSSSGTRFKCDSCGVEYNYNEDGTISCINGESKFTRVSDWYYWEKEEVRQEVLKGTYSFEDEVRVERLKNTALGMVPEKGKFYLTHTIKDGITVTGSNCFRYERSALQSYAIHIEYNYKNRGGCLDLANNTDTYFVYPLNKTNALTKIHFAVEAIYDYQKAKLNNGNN